MVFAPETEKHRPSPLSINFAAKTLALWTRPLRCGVIAIYKRDAWLPRIRAGGLRPFLRYSSREPGRRPP